MCISNPSIRNITYALISFALVLSLMLTTVSIESQDDTTDQPDTSSQSENTSNDGGEESQPADTSNDGGEESQPADTSNDGGEESQPADRPNNEGQLVDGSENRFGCEGRGNSCNKDGGDQPESEDVGEGAVMEEVVDEVIVLDVPNQPPADGGDDDNDDDDYHEPIRQESSEVIVVEIIQPEHFGDILGYVWQDTNVNAILEDNEIPLSQVLVTLFSTNGNVVSVSTNSGGYYHFTDLLEGIYTVQIIAFDQYFEQTIRLSAQETKYVNFGLSNSRNISGIIWVDDNQNGHQSIEERGFEGIQVQLINLSGEIVATQIVQPNGRYIFSDVLPGEWGVRVNETTIPSTAFVTFDVDGNRDFEAPINLKSYQNINNANFGIVTSS